MELGVALLIKTLYCIVISFLFQIVSKDDHPSHEAEVEEEIPPPTISSDQDGVPTAEDNVSIVETHVEERPQGGGAEHADVDKAHEGPDLGVETDGGHFNKNEDNQPSYGAAEEMQKIPPAVLDKPFDLGLSVELDHSSGRQLGGFLLLLLLLVVRWCG